MKSVVKMGVVAAMVVGLIGCASSVFAQDAQPTPAKVKSHHEGPPPASGEISSVDKDSITIKDHKGVELKFKITEKTKFGTNKSPQKLEDLKQGEHVLVTYHGEGDAAEALVIRELPAHGHGHVNDLKK